MLSFKRDKETFPPDVVIVKLVVGDRALIEGGSSCRLHHKLGRGKSPSENEPDICQ